MLDTLIVRNDSLGGGHFHSSRNGRKHNGTDYVVQKGQAIYAPENVEILRHANPYSGDDSFGGLYMKGASGLRYKVFYMKPLKNLVGKELKKGDLIGHAQAISERYNDKMIDHIHVYVFDKNGNHLDPEKHIKKKELAHSVLSLESLLSGLSLKIGDDVYILTKKT